HLARLHEQVHAAQRVHFVLPHAVDLGQAPRLDHVAHRHTLRGAHQNSPGGRGGPLRCCDWNGLVAVVGALPVVTAAITFMPSRRMGGPLMAVRWPSVMPVCTGTAFTLPSSSRNQRSVGGAPGAASAATPAPARRAAG